MSKNTNLSFLTDFLTADIVNSRVGMNNVSPQSTFDVTGTGKFSGILTLGSTVSNGTYTYTLPSATGTLALTSDIPSVSGYVPYTGANQSVDLGYNSLAASFLRVNGTGPTLGSYLGFKHSTNVTAGADGYTSIYTFGTNLIGFKSISGATTRDFSFSMASITPGIPGGRTYTLPDADGTIALTSSLGSYLPLAGGTLTGNLNGTTSIFGSAFASNQTSKIGIGFDSGYGLINAWGADSSTFGGLKFQISESDGNTYDAFRVDPSGEVFFGTGGYYGLIDAAFLKVGAANGQSQALTPPVAKFINSSNNFVKIALGQGETNPNFNDYYGIIALDNAVNLDDNKLRFYLGYDDAVIATHSNDQLVIQGNGNVGIGTASPLKKLDVYENGTATVEQYIRNITINGLLKIEGTSSFQIGTETNHPLFLITNNSTRMSIGSAGAVTINNLGTGTVTATAGVLSTVSDSSFKVHDGFIDSALEKVLNLKPRYFYWNEKSGLPTNVRQLGFYAQEVNQAIGEEAANTPADENTPWGITDRSIIAMLTKAIQEQQEQIQELKNKLS